MTASEKEEFCLMAAGLVAPPEIGLLRDLGERDLRAYLLDVTREWRCDEGLLSPLFEGWTAEDAFPRLEAEYNRLFADPEGERISLVESTYKPWTTDKGCGMVFAGSKGLVRGDPALHMEEVYRQLALEVPEEYRATPDHLVMELELLGLLFRVADREQIKRFVEDHLDWIPDLLKELKRVEAHSFYRNGVELVRLFLERGMDDRNSRRKRHE
jgi:TorA maturation chaperone TorD